MEKHEIIDLYSSSPSSSCSDHSSLEVIVVTEKTPESLTKTLPFQNKKRPRHNNSNNNDYSSSLSLSSTITTQSISNNNDNSCETTNCFVYLKDSDCIITEHLMDLFNNIPRVYCCATTTNNNNSNKSNDYHSSNKRMKKPIQTSFPMFHIQQLDKWSCGFRNMQMILSSIVPFLSLDHSFWYYYYYDTSSSSMNQSATSHSTTTNTITTTTTTTTIAPTSMGWEIPSVLTLQNQMEASWKDGFDADGTKHYQNKIVGKKVWIGAVEVSSLLSYMGIDATVIQFIHCTESRQQLIPFCMSYFQRYHHHSKNDYLSACPKPDTLSSMDIVQTLLQRDFKKINNSNTTTTTTTTTTTSNDFLESKCVCDVLPLYLQWKGHSVSVVGYEVETNGNVHLLVFDPLKRGCVLEQALRKQQLKPLRLDKCKLDQQDCQIVLCSTRSLDQLIREKIKQCVQTVTAAESAVLRTLCQNAK